jgi:hypothetical protein
MVCNRFISISIKRYYHKTINIFYLSFTTKIKKNMKRIIISAMATLFMVVLISNSSFAQAQGNKIVKKLTAQSVDVNRGENPNIKSERPTDDKVAEKSRDNCSIYFDNYTGYYISIYVDGKYKGELAPYGSGTVVVGEGYTTIYCITAGKTKEWNASGNCEGSYTYKLYYN